jgi:ribosomal protein S2
MKIIQHGINNPGPVIYRGTCQRCRCIIEASAEETKELTIDRDYTPGAATRYVKCPDCSNEYLWVRPVNSQ